MNTLELHDPRYAVPRFGERARFPQSAFTKIMTRAARIANADTPEGIDVPANLQGLSIYSFTKLGAMGMLCATVMFLFNKNEDQHEKTDKVLQQQISDQQKMIDMHQRTIDALNATIQGLKTH